MMIDLSLLLSNVKTCSYVKKNSNMPNKESIKLEKQEKMDTPQLVNQITSKINIPKPDTVTLKNVKANVLVANSNSNSTYPAQLLEITKEPFVSDSNSSNFGFGDFLIVIVTIIVIILLYLLIFE
jgi:tRNA G37 N-methylase Trm5